MSLREALEKAEEAGVDLVEISPNAEPPVCRIMDYGKFLYERASLLRNRRKSKKLSRLRKLNSVLVQMSDYQVKLRSLIRFLEEGDKAKITLRFRGREMAHQQIGMEVLNRVKDDLQELAVVESFPTKIEGRQMIMVLAPKKKQ